MAIERYYFKDSGSIELPIDGVFYTDEFSPEYEGNLIVIAFYDSSGDIVTASTGTVTVEVTPIKGQWFNGVSSGDATITASEAGATATYGIPVFLGPVTQARITLASVAGADHAKAYLWRY
jgi:hypothetical protein